jgi:2,4-dienoyl-CoA reductase-like NADH-dependent reductase (Old Yellow Enzyme family)
VHGFPRRVLDEGGKAAFEGDGRDRADIVGSDTYTAASRQTIELLAWRRAGCWDRAILAVGGITTPERAHEMLREGADTVLVATAALYAPLFSVRFREQRASAVA